MVSSLKTDSGLIYAYIEWYIINRYGQFKDFGDYIYIHDCWIHQAYRYTDALRKLIYLIDTNEKAKSSHFVYWLNLKHKERKTPIYKRSRLARMGVQYGEQEI